jgi:2-C-methyl-D-erythritol 4-phosphate cytidylyltransferase
MGGRTYARHGGQSRAERIVDGLQGSLLQVDISWIVVHEADEPNALVDFLDSKLLAGQHAGDAVFAMQADAPAGGDHDVAVVEGVVQLRQAPIGAR